MTFNLIFLEFPFCNKFQVTFYACECMKLMFMRDEKCDPRKGFLDRSLLKTALNAVGISDNDLYVTILKKDYPRVGVILVFALIQSQLQ